MTYNPEACLYRGWNCSVRGRSQKSNRLPVKIHDRRNKIHFQFNETGNQGNNSDFSQSANNKDFSQSVNENERDKNMILTPLSSQLMITFHLYHPFFGNVFYNDRNYQLPAANNDDNLEENGLAIVSKKESEQINPPILTYGDKIKALVVTIKGNTDVCLLVI